MTSSGKIRSVNYATPEIKPSEFPDVDILIPTYGEPEYIVERTIVGALNIDYPDKSKIHIFLCDDSHRDSLKKMASGFKINYLSRKDNVDKKAGNLNNALKKAKSPYILTLDADMSPKKDILLRLVPFFIDEK